MRAPPDPLRKIIPNLQYVKRPELPNPTTYNVNYYKRVVCETYPTYEECAEIARNNKIKNLPDWIKFIDDVKNGRDHPGVIMGRRRLPLEPHTVYYWKWINFKAFISTDYDEMLEQLEIVKKNESYYILSFEELRNFAISKKFTDCNKWREFVVRNDYKYLPIRPMVYQTYKHQWEGWHHFLGIPLSKLSIAAAKTYKSFTLPYDEAKKHIRDIFTPCNTKSKTVIQKTWSQYRRDNNIIEIPTHPHKFYIDDWVSWDAFLGIIRVDEMSIYIPKYNKIQTNYLYIAYYDDPYMHGLYDVGIENDSTSPIQARLKQTGAKLIQLFQFNPDDRVHITRILRNYLVSTTAQHVYRLNNLHQLSFELSQYANNLPLSALETTHVYNTKPTMMVDINKYQPSNKQERWVLDI